MLEEKHASRTRKMRKDFTEELHMFPTLKDERRDATSDKKQEGGPPEQR